MTHLFFNNFNRRKAEKNRGNFPCLANVMQSYIFGTDGSLRALPLRSFLLAVEAFSSTLGMLYNWHTKVDSVEKIEISDWQTSSLAVSSEPVHHIAWPLVPR